MKFVLSVLVLVICADSGLCKRNNIKKPPATKDATFEYFTKSHHGIAIPVMVHLDQALTPNLSAAYKSRTREKSKNMFRNILNNVETLFSHQSLNQTVQFTLLDVKFVRNGTKRLVMDENVSNYLGSYCRWQGEKKKEKKKWYYSILFTGLDVFYYGRNNMRVRSSTGRGYLKGICSEKYSCTILEWHRNNIALKLAHEIGHSLGISHDGAPDNQCRADSHIMAAKYSHHYPAKTWSSCSKRDFQHFLTSKYSWCLRPESKNII